MSYRISLGTRNAVVDAVTTLFDKGARPNNSTINIYSNATSQPASPESGVPGGSVLLSQVPFSADAFANSVGGTGIATGLPLTAAVVNSGTAGWFRFYTGEASPTSLGDGTISITSGGGDMTFDNISFVSGGTVSITSFSLTIPA